MCGLIMGEGLSREQIFSGLRAMNHRGSFWVPPEVHEGPRWSIGHHRLPIQTKEGDDGKQPFVNGREVMAFVGEVFTNAGRRVVEKEEEALWEALGSRSFRGFMNLDGFWAVVYANHNTGRAVAMTDFLGTKPLYYWRDRRIVCSEIQPMFAAAGYTPPKDSIYLSNCVKFGYDYSGRTPWEGVVQVPPGSYVNFHPQGSEYDEIVPYWDWSRVKTDATLAQNFIASMVNRITGFADLDSTPPGILLSGGLDSWTVYQATQNILGPHTPHPFQAFSTPNLDDQDYLPDHPNVTLLPDGGSVSLNWALFVMEAPVDLGSLIPQIYLAQALKKDKRMTTVVLTGDGADELFGGYQRAKQYDSQASDVFCELPYYHLPRLDKVHMRYTQEVRSPFLAPSVIRYALDLPYSQRTNKQEVKTLARYLGVPQRIIEREKVPLKSAAVREGGLQYRIQLLEKFNEIY